LDDLVFSHGILDGEHNNTRAIRVEYAHIEVGLNI